MATAIINKTIEIPNVGVQETEYQIIGQSKRTAGGKLRRDVAATKRVWRLTARYLSTSQYNDIIDYLQGIMYATTWFWLDEFGGNANDNSIEAIIDIGADSRHPVAGHTIELVVNEV